MPEISGSYVPKVGDLVRLSEKGLEKIGLHTKQQVEAQTHGFTVTYVDGTLGNYPGEFYAVDVDGPFSDFSLMDEDLEPLFERLLVEERIALAERLRASGIHDLFGHA